MTSTKNINSETPSGTSEPYVLQGVKVVEQRMRQYGPPEENFKDIATMWSVMLGTGVSPLDVIHCMIALKMCREKYKHSPDNLVDMGGYEYIAEMFQKNPEMCKPALNIYEESIENKIERLKSAVDRNLKNHKLIAVEYICPKCKLIGMGDPNTGCLCGSCGVHMEKR